MVKRTLRAAVSAGFLVGAAASASAQVLEIGADQSPAGLDPHIITAFASFVVVNNTIYEGLTAIDKNLNVVPSLAESWTVSPDGKTYTFKLRSGVKFHDGSPMDANDVASTIRRCCRRTSPLRSQAVSPPSRARPRSIRRPSN